jgi:hypothetical protein
MSAMYFLQIAGLHPNARKRRNLETAFLWP